MKEKELEDKLEVNLDKIEKGLTLIERQKRVRAGIIDLFCRDKEGRYVLVEVKIKPSERVVAQLARYNMALVKDGLSKERLRTILVAKEFSNAVKESCKFFNFEIKKVSREDTWNKKIKAFNKPEREELITFIKKKKFVNLSMIARKFDIYNMAASKIINNLEKEGIVTTKIFGGSKVVLLK